MYVGFTDNHELLDGDRDFSDDEAKANSTRLGGNHLGTPAVVVIGHRQGVQLGDRRDCSTLGGCRIGKLWVEERKAMTCCGCS